jgi:cytoskeletal protein RodZ
MSADRGERPVEHLGGGSDADVGARLREARERRGLTIQALSSATKIKPVTLEAIERNDIGHFPGGPYARGHVRAYAAEVGLNPNETAAEWVAQFRPPAEEPPPAPERPPAAVNRRLVAMLGTAVAVVVCGVALVMFAFTRQTGEVAEQPRVPTAASAETDAIGTQGTGTTQAQAASPLEATQAPVDSRPLRIEVLPSGDCWVSVRADGELAIFRVMRQGEREVVEADETLVVNVGDAGTFVYRINGAPGRSLGGPGAVVTVRITENTYRTFVADVTARN